MSGNRCARCNRKIKDPDATYGKVCKKKVEKEIEDIPLRVELKEFYGQDMADKLTQTGT